MSDNKTMIRFFTIADFKEEELWLQKQHQQGWKLIKMIPPCIYRFEKCKPETVIYRLDYKNNRQNEDFMLMMKDYGWEYLTQCLGWLYFRKPASSINNENEGEIFSDNASRANMLQNIIYTRMFPLLIIFLCCIIPNFSWFFKESIPIAVLWSIVFMGYVVLLAHCGRKLWDMKKELK